MRSGRGRPRNWRATRRCVCAAATTRAHQFLLDNMTHAGRAGYEVLTPLLLDDGRVLLVNRGWLPLPDGRRDELP